MASILNVVSIIEPISYFPVLGQTGMYRAFMIGNIAKTLAFSLRHAVEPRRQTGNRERFVRQHGRYLRSRIRPRY